MPNILINAANQYIAQVQSLLNNDVNFPAEMNAMVNIFPSFGESEARLIAKLANSLTELVPTLTRLLGDVENLFNDRVLASSIICYLISPFDIIPDEYGIVGTIDDALIAFHLAT